MDNQETMKGVLAGRVFRQLGSSLLLAAIMFVPGGIGWWQGWLFLVIFVLQMAFAALYLWAKTPRFSSPVARSAEKPSPATRLWLCS